MTELLVAAPRWLLLGILVFAPWAYGCTEDWAITWLNILMSATVALWLLGCTLRKRTAVVNFACVACVAFILAQGWFITFNAHYWCAPKTLEFFPIKSFLHWAPGTVDQQLSLPIMFRFTGLLGILCFVTDLAQRPEWRLRLWWTIAGTGVSLILFGIMERVTQAPRIFWQQPKDSSWQWPYFFATYFYHANAGAFINLVIPIVAGLVILAFRKADAHGEQAIWLPSLVVSIAGAFVNVSKAAMVLATFLLLFLAIWRFRESRHLGATLPRKLIITYSALGFIAFVAIAITGWLVAGARWIEMIQYLTTKNERLLSEGACLRIIPEAGFWGFGPGTFQHVFPHYTFYLGDAIAGYWKFAHEDYMQTIIEWGWIGAPIVAIIFFGGIFLAFQNYTRRTDLASRDRILLFTVGLALIGVGLHSFIDFPLQIASIQLYVAVYLGIAWGGSQWRGKLA